MINKFEHATLLNKFRLIFNYSQVKKNLSDYYLKLYLRIYDYLSSLIHQIFMQINIKYEYFSVRIHSENWHIFAFTVSDIEQLQLTCMSQETKSVSFIWMKLMNFILESISSSNSELSLLHFIIDISESLLSYTVYIDNIFSEHTSSEK